MDSSQAPPAAQAHPAAPTPPSAAIPAEGPVASVAPPPVDEIALARGGDVAALKRLELVPAAERTIEQALAIDAGHAVRAQREARRLASDMREDPSLLEDSSTLAHAYRLALDPVVAPDLLGGLAAIEHPTVADLFDDLVARGEPGGRGGLVVSDLLASDLLERRGLRSKASPALKVILDLRTARDCWQTGEALARATQHADDRALRLLEPLATETGCGPKKLDDCYPCLRMAPYADRLPKAIEASASRRFIPQWRKPDPPRQRAGSAQQRKPVE